MKEGRLRRLARALAVALVSTLAALASAEATVRLAGWAPPPRGASKSLKEVVQNVPEERAPGVGRRHVPGAVERRTYAGKGSQPDREVVYRINALGLRDGEVSARKPAGTYRICVVGDSFTFGTAIDLEETFPKVIQRQLEALAPDRAVEVLNCGMEAINLLQEAALIENRIARLEPDLVLVCAYINDASGHGIPGADLAPGAAARLAWIERLGLTSGVWAAGEERTDAQRRTMALRRRSHLVDLLAHRAYRWLYGPISRANYERDWAPGSPGLAAAREALARTAALAQRAGFALHVTMYPVLQGLEGEYPYAGEHARLARIAAELDLPYHDLTDVLRDQTSRELHAHAHDAHPNARCNELVGAALARALLPWVRGERD